MRKNIIWIVGAMAVLFGLSLGPAQADFIQCPGGPCNATANSDIVNGTDLFDDIGAGAGNDVIFSGDGDDESSGDLDDDIVFGGLGDDEIEGNDGNDILLAGPDVDENSTQLVLGSGGADSVFVFAGEIQGCLYIDGNDGTDVVNLVGFGPYSSIAPFGQAGFGFAWVQVIDPITGGSIFINVNDVNDADVEIINGLPTPNVTIVGSEALGNCEEFD